MTTENKIKKIATLSLKLKLFHSGIMSPEPCALNLSVASHIFRNDEEYIPTEIPIGYINGFRGFCYRVLPGEFTPEILKRSNPYY